jgi:hypothetical protein
MNKGSANAYQDFVFRFSVFKDKAELYSQTIKPVLGTSLWQPGQSVIITSDLGLSPTLPDGDYDFVFSLVEEASNKIVQIANSENYNNGFFKLFSFNLENGYIRLAPETVTPPRIWIIP